MKISDYAGNETFRTAIVNVNPLSFLQIIPEFTPPTTNTELPTNQLPSDEEEQSFGNENNGNVGSETASNASGGETIFADAIAQAGTMTSSSNLFNFGNENTSTSTTNTNILWGAVAAAAVGMTLAEWQKRREEEEKERQSERPNTAGRKKYEEKMRMKRMIGESQALLNQKYAEKQAQKKIQENVHKHLMNEHRDQTGVYQGKAQQEQAKQNAVSAARWTGIAQLEQAKLQKNLSWFDKWTSPAKLPSKLTFGKPKWVDNVVNPFARLPLELLYSQIEQITPKSPPADNKFLNFANNLFSYTSGATRQFADDLTIGLLGHLTGWKPENGNEFYQEGREVGRTLSTYYGYLELAIGGALFLKGAVEFTGSLLATLGCGTIGGPPGGATCAAISSPIAVVGVSEMIGGAVLAGHGGALLANNANKPLQIRSEGGGSGNVNELLRELKNSGVKFNKDEIVEIMRGSDGKITWLETGNQFSGLEHIVDRHASQFAARGIAKSQISDAIMTAITEGEKIIQVRGGAIYRFEYAGKTQDILVVTGDNGYIVTAYPVTP